MVRYINIVHIVCVCVCVCVCVYKHLCEYLCTFE
jgi:hypothetical protein